MQNDEKNSDNAWDVLPKLWRGFKIRDKIAGNSGELNAQFGGDDTAYK